MAINPRQLKVPEAVRLLNSTPLGEVVQPHVVYRHLNRAGYRIGDGRNVDLLRYTAWLFHERRANQAQREQANGPAGYEALKEKARQRNAALSESGRDIAAESWVHEPVDRERKKAAERSFRFFCETYFPPTFHLPWSRDHLKVIAKIETAVLHGGLFAMAMPRGSGKTTVCETACLWAILIGARDFVCLIGADEEHAESMLDSIKSELENNDRLEEDFSEVCGPIRALEGIANRAGGQLYQGQRTHIGWTAKEIALPTLPGSRASGAIIKVAGITGRIRGMKHKRADGTPVRPSLVLLDDPQTDESARSLSQCATREQILAGAILGLAGPGQKIAGLMTLTVVRPGDMADRILDREKHPAWQAERTKMVYAFPTNEKLWAQYAQIRAASLRNEQGLKPATDFYAQHQAEMDEGAAVAWPQRFNHDEISAIQHAMNLKLDNEQAFYAEYQNEPLPEEEADSDLLTADQIVGKTNGHAPREIPLGANHLTLFVDVQATLLYWLVCAWEDDFTGYVVDYGTFPEQRQAYFTLREARRTLAAEFPSAGQEGQIYGGLEKLTQQLLPREWKRDDGAMLRIERALVDANWGTSTDVVYQFCRQSPLASVLMPSHGRFVGASSIPFSDYKRKQGDRVGLNWRIPNVQGKRAVRHVVFDSNYWKSFVQARLAVPMGDPGCMSLFGHRADLHRMLADQLTAEYRVKTQGRGRTVDEWKLRAAGQDNHWLDALVGCAVAASMQGCILFGTDVKPLKRERIRLSALQGRNR